MEGNSVILEYLGTPPGGGISALTIAGRHAPIGFAGTSIGLYRSRFSTGELPLQWETLVQAPLGILALAASPQYDVDHLLFAGTTTGLYVSQDDGESWSPARLPQANSTILCFAFSPQFEQDGIILAGSLEDGVLFSDDRGRSWSLRSFGLLDPTVYCLSLSPDFANDGIAFAGTQTALYYSYNHARAWRMLDFPEDAAPILSLAVSPSFPTDGIVLAGTETMGLFRSADQGESWHRLPLEVCSVPAICHPSTDQLLIASEEGLMFSDDQGETWKISSHLEDVQCLVYQDRLWLAGTSDQGLWAKHNAMDWQPISALAARAFVGMTPSPRFAEDRTLFLYGPQEGIWSTLDGGKSWHCLNDRLPSSEVISLTAAATPQGGLILAAATPAGCLVSEDSGNTWQLAFAVPARFAVFSDGGKWLAAVLERNGIVLSGDFGKSWQPLAGAWEQGGQILALQILEDGSCYLAWLESTGKHLSLWQGRAGNMQPMLQLPTTEKTLVSIYAPSDGESWFAAMGHQVWRLPSKDNAIIDGIPAGEVLLGLSGVSQGGGKTLYAFTASRLFQSSDGVVWKVMKDFYPQRIVAQAVFAEGGIRQAVCLLAGDGICRVAIDEKS